MVQQPWQVLAIPGIPLEYQEALKPYSRGNSGYVAKLLWYRGIQKSQDVAGFLNPDEYQPTSSWDFGQEMKWAVQRLWQAREAGEKIAIWGDFDADGITATSVLWEGLGEFFRQYKELFYYIPDRLRQSHGLNCEGIDRLAQQNITLIVTCDTGSTNLVEIEYARSHGIDVIVTDHHTLPEERPEVVAIINPRYFADNHPLYHLSGVAVAYKLIEAMYDKLPDIPRFPKEELLDLVVIGLIADLVSLQDDCRYLAQKGIAQLRQTSRPGVRGLLDSCMAKGDRPTDISFGIGPRINAVSRIQGDSSFCVELLTSKKVDRCQELVELAELCNDRRKALQEDITKAVRKRVSNLDLSTMPVIVLEDPQWPPGLLGLAAGRIAQEYYRPTILLSSGNNGQGENLAVGSARSTGNIDLYQLVASQANLLHRFGGHPFAAGMSMPSENIEIFTQSINQEARRLNLDTISPPPLVIDLVVTVAELGKDLYQQLKLIEPCGMGNPSPKLLIENCYLERVFNSAATKDKQGNKLTYKKTIFEVWDDSSSRGFPGIWWGHTPEDIPIYQEGKNRFDIVVEMDCDNTPSPPRLQVRLVDIRPKSETTVESLWSKPPDILDWRRERVPIDTAQKVRTIEDCPHQWQEITKEYHNANRSKETLALAYGLPATDSGQEKWQQLVGIAKYLHRSGKTIITEVVKAKLKVSYSTLQLGLSALQEVGFHLEATPESLKIDGYQPRYNWDETLLDRFITAVAEEEFQRRYFYQVPVATVQANF